MQRLCAAGGLDVTTRLIELPWEELYEPPCSMRYWPAYEWALQKVLFACGIEQPLTVRPRGEGGGWEIVRGAGTWRAAVGLIVDGAWAPDVCLPCRVTDKSQEGDRCTAPES